MEFMNLWSLGHFVQWSFVGRFLFRNWRVFLVISIGWELVELVLPYEFAAETWSNKCGDLAINGIGFALGRSLRKYDDQVGQRSP